MKTLRITLCSICFLFYADGVVLLAQLRYTYEVEKVLDNVYVLKPKISDYRWVTSNISVVINKSDVLVVDSGLLPAAAEAAIKEIRKITNKPVRFLVNTHWHGDHWQGNETFLKEYPYIQIISTDQTYKAISRNGMAWVNTYYPKYFQNYIEQFEKSIQEKKYNDKPLDDSGMRELKAGLEDMQNDLTGIKSLKPQLPTLTFVDKLVLKSEDHEVQILYLGIGNTSGDAIVFLPAEKILITGDLVVYPSPYESGMFSPEWLETSIKLDQLEFEHLIPGHGDVQHDHIYLKTLNGFFSEIIKQVEQAYKKGFTRPEEIREQVTHQTVIDELTKNPMYEDYIKNLDSSFVPAAIQTAHKRIIQGKQ